MQVVYTRGVSRARPHSPPLPTSQCAVRTRDKRAAAAPPPLGFTLIRKRQIKKHRYVPDGLSAAQWKKMQADKKKNARSRRPAVLRRLHAIDATRLRQTRSGVVFFSIPGRFAGRRERRLALVDVFRRRAHESLSQSLWRSERSVRRDRVGVVRWRCPRNLSFWSGKSLTRRALAARCHLRHVRWFDCGVVLLLPKRRRTRPRLV